jgi:hypothetical protein
VAAVSRLADDVDRLNLPAAGDMLTWLAPHLERLQREAERVFRRS